MSIFVREHDPAMGAKRPPMESKVDRKTYYGVDTSLIIAYLDLNEGVPSSLSTLQAIHAPWSPPFKIAQNAICRYFR